MSRKKLFSDHPECDILKEMRSGLLQKKTFRRKTVGKAKATNQNGLQCQKPKSQKPWRKTKRNFKMFQF